MLGDDRRDCGKIEERLSVNNHVGTTKGLANIRHCFSFVWFGFSEPQRGIEPLSTDYETVALPLNYRGCYSISLALGEVKLCAELVPKLAVFLLKLGDG